MRPTAMLRAGLASLLVAHATLAVAAADLGYDPQADPFADLEAAKAEAAAAGKLVLVVAGGEWCVWCHYLDAFLTGHPAIKNDLYETFVVMKAYLGDENDNAAFFATLPEAVGYPHFWIVDPDDGAVLESQNTLPLEDGGKSYDEAAFTAFVGKWRP